MSESLGERFVAAASLRSTVRPDRDDAVGGRPRRSYRLTDSGAGPDTDAAALRAAAEVAGLPLRRQRIREVDLAGGAP